MSLLKANSVQIGQSATGTNNFTLSVPSSPDGTIKLARGNSGATTADILSVSSSGAVTINNLNNQSFRNRIINGDMRIDQRNAGASHTVTASATTYTIDRFTVLPSGSNVTAQRIADTTGGRQFYYQINGAAGISQLEFSQRIEAANSADLAGGSIVISADLANSVLTTVSWVLYAANAKDNFGANTAVTGGSWTVTSSLARYSSVASIPSGSEYQNGLYLIMYVNNQTTGNWKIANVQLEAGSTATEFERRPIGTELALCQRYYDKSYSMNVAPGTVTNNGMVLGVQELYVPNSWYVGGGAIKFATEMRRAPDFNYRDNQGNLNRFSSFWNGSIGNNVNPGITLYAGTKGVALHETSGPSGGYAGSPLLCHYTADAEL
jgi:hypothetical protein